MKNKYFLSRHNTSKIFCTYRRMDFYQRLDVDRTAGKQEIRKAYYRLAKEHHPDRCKNSDSADTFQQIQEAYDVLSDEHKKQEYDRSLHFDQTFSSMFVDIDSILRDMHIHANFPNVPNVSSQFQRDQSTRNEDYSIVTLSVQEYLDGCSKVIHTTAEATCECCHGTAVKHFHQNSLPCNACNSTGMQFVFPCGRCGGLGRVILNDVPCDVCEKRGHIIEELHTEVYIKPRQERNSILEINGLRIKIEHGFQDNITEIKPGVLQLTKPISVISWLCGHRVNAMFGNMKYEVATDGIFDLNAPFVLPNDLQVKFQLSLDDKQLNKLRRFGKIFRQIFKRPSPSQI